MSLIVPISPEIATRLAQYPDINITAVCEQALIRRMDMIDHANWVRHTVLVDISRCTSVEDLFYLFQDVCKGTAWTEEFNQAYEARKLHLLQLQGQKS